jgi:hypothetical protein
MVVTPGIEMAPPSLVKDPPSQSSTVVCAHEVVWLVSVCPVDFIQPDGDWVPESQSARSLNASKRSLVVFLATMSTMSRIGSEIVWMVRPCIFSMPRRDSQISSLSRSCIVFCSMQPTSFEIWRIS